MIRHGSHLSGGVEDAASGIVKAKVEREDAVNIPVMTEILEITVLNMVRLLLSLQ